MGPFDIINLMFDDYRKFKELKNNDKKKNMFMINRRFAINFPTIAQKFNHIHSPGGKIVDNWGKIAQKYSSKPKWMFLKSNKKKSDKEEKLDIDEEVINTFLEKKELTHEQLDRAFKFEPEKVRDMLEEFEERMKVV